MRARVGKDIQLSVLRVHVLLQSLKTTFYLITVRLDRLHVLCEDKWSNRRKFELVLSPTQFREVDAVLELQIFIKLRKDNVKKDSTKDVCGVWSVEVDTTTARSFMSFSGGVCRTAKG